MLNAVVTDKVQTTSCLR